MTGTRRGFTPEIFWAGLFPVLKGCIESTRIGSAPDKVDSAPAFRARARGETDDETALNSVGHRPRHRRWVCDRTERECSSPRDICASRLDGVAVRMPCRRGLPDGMFVKGGPN